MLVSIHAPRVGRDSLAAAAVQGQSAFQSTRPCRFWSPCSRINRVPSYFLSSLVTPLRRHRATTWQSASGFGVCSVVLVNAVASVQPGDVLDSIDITAWQPAPSQQGLPGDCTPPWRLPEGMRQPEPWIIWLGVVLQFFRSRIAESALNKHKQKLQRVAGAP
jgi:hypothetical protein